MLQILAALVLASTEAVTIHYGQPAKTVAFAGDLNQWNPTPMNDTGHGWEITFQLPKTARFEYKLVVDQQWILDPANNRQHGNGFGGANSVYEGPGYHPTAYPESEPRHPMTRYHMSAAGRPFDVFLPERWWQAPIMVYGDGESYESFGHIEKVYENLIEAHKIRPVVLVLVPPKNRMREYGADYAAYASLLFDSILPLLRKNELRLSARPEDLYIGGSSMGGVVALRLAEEYPDKVKGGIQSQSGAFQYPLLDVKYGSLVAGENLAKVAPGARLWLCWGTFEDGLTTANEAAATALHEMHRPFGSMVTDEGHNWTAWRNRMVPGIVYLFGRR